MTFYTKTVEDTLKTLKTSENGISTDDFKMRLKEYGRNSLQVKGESWWRKLTEPFRNVFMAVLIFAAILSAVTDHALDAVIIIVIIAISAGIYYVQRFSTEKVLRALKRHDAQQVRVLRDGTEVRVESEELVPGDIILLNEGEKVPADARVMHADSIRSDEALLTGESAPVAKYNHALKGEKAVFEQTNMLFQGAYIVSGETVAIVTATGNATEFGRIAALAGAAHEPSPAQKKIDSLITKLIGIIFVVVSLAYVLTLYRGIELSEGLRFVLALAVSSVPEGLPVAISVILVLGMRRLAKRRALVRSMAAIENVGIVTTIATDKTGTLTKNILTVQEVWQLHATREATQQMFLAAIHNNGKTADPLDTAFLNYARDMHIDHPSGRTLAVKLPFNQAAAMSGNVWQEGEVYEVLLKGAPEHVIRRCKMTSAEREKAEQKLHSLTGQGYRVIALARIAPLRKLAASIEELPEKDMYFIGLVAVADILRKDAKPAIAAALSAGVSVRMITGDHVETAYAIGKQLGLVKHRDQVLDCRALAAVSDKKLAELIDETKVFARVLPEHKYRILDALKQTNITAMTGDGVNDVPALAKANIGFAMGSGTQIAKESGDIVLLNDSFRTIVDAIRGGRVIFDNIRRMLFYLLATSLGQAIAIIGALVIGMPLPVVAVQVLWINLVTDSCLVIPLGLEPAEDDVMKRRPRRWNQPILDRHLIQRLIIVAVTMAATALGIFQYFYVTSGNNLEYAQTITFSSLVVMQWANAVNARSEWQTLFVRLRQHNMKFYVGMLIAIVIQALAMFGPLAPALHVVPVDVNDLVISGLIAVGAIILVAELHKWYGRRRQMATA